MHPRCPQDSRMNQFWTQESQNLVNPAAVWWPGRVPDSSPLECDASNSLAALSAATFPNVPQRSRIRQGLLAAFTRERRPGGFRTHQTHHQFNSILRLSKCCFGIFDFIPSLLRQARTKGSPPPPPQRLRTAVRRKRATAGRCQAYGSQMEANI